MKKSFIAIVLILLFPLRAGRIKRKRKKFVQSICAPEKNALYVHCYGHKVKYGAKNIDKERKIYKY